MKRIFSIFLICCTTFACADETPVFEECDESKENCAYSTFAPEEPIFEEDDETQGNNMCEECDEPEHLDASTMSALNLRTRHLNREESEEGVHASYLHWQRFKANFGMEKLFVRFPATPTISQSNTLLTAYAYDYGILYSLTGYYPPVGNINPVLWFDEILCSVDHYPYSLISHVAYQVSNGDWVLDYTFHDYVQNIIGKGRAIATPFNGYTLQCVKPNGSRDHFDYFLDSFWIRCECN
jgi:hypothetical protein